MGVFLDKPKKEKETEEGEGNGLHYAMCSMQGWRVEMEDAHSIHLKVSPSMENLSYFAVFDGHAGDFVSKYSSEHLLEYVMKQLKGNNTGGGNADGEAAKGKPYEFQNEDFEAKLKAAFLNFDKEMREHEKFRDGNDRSGTTAVSAFISDTKVVFANCGDSRGLLSTKTGTIIETYDHKPQNDIERKRIEEAGGSVIIQRVNGSLAVSRALGDYDYKNNSSIADVKQLVSPEPDITFYDRTADDEFLILACDGVWDVMTNQECVEYIRSRLKISSNLKKVCEELLETCLAKGSRDNMSVILITFSAAPQLCEDAIKKEQEVDECIKTKVKELIKNQPDSTLNTVVSILAEENIAGLPAGGGIHAKVPIVEETLNQLFPDRQEKEAACASAFPVSVLRNLQSAAASQLAQIDDDDLSTEEDSSGDHSDNTQK